MREKGTGERPAKMRTGKRLYQTAAEWMGAEADMIAPIPVFIFRGRREIEAAGCDGILEYGPEKIVLSAMGELFTVKGRGLTLEDFSDGDLFVRGEIGTAFFGTEGEEADGERA
ncbi:MAG: YabP/YqfC family sporulation protein [Clostridia bacterium]|nr:YabP/YqfC family sporulation protein [Clostridia bacterium]